MRYLLFALALVQTVPMPQALVDAKTVYLVNDGVPGKAIENTVKALNAWHRWTITSEAAEADITITVRDALPTHVYNPIVNTTYVFPSQFLSITGRDGTVLYGATFARLNPEKQLAQLRKLLEGK